MQALALDAVSGWRWVKAGWRLFRRQPLGFTALLFFYWLVLLTASVIVGWIAQAVGKVLPFVSADVVAVLGSLLVAMLTPALTVGFLQACRAADSGLPVHPVLLFAPFRAGRQTLQRLIALGFVQMLALTLILLATSGTSAFRDDPATPPRVATTATEPAPAASPGARRDASGTASNADTPTEAEQEAIRREAVQRLVQGVGYLPVALLLWYAPLLVAWHGVPPGKALFFSVVAVWRNRTAFVVYGLAWMAIWVTLSVVIGLFASLIGLGNLAALLAAPLVMLLLTCMYCSVYPSYATVFVDPERPQPDSGPEAPQEAPRP